MKYRIIHGMEFAAKLRVICETPLTPCRDNTNPPEFISQN